MEEEKYKPYWLIITLTMQIILYTILFTRGMNNNTLSYNILTDIGLVSASLILIINIIFWLYSFISILLKDFKKDINKITWLIAIIFVPFCWIFYLDAERIIIKKKKVDKNENLNDKVINIK
ncbi:hypothetical protein CRU98_10105 [Arcobacter sp. CECT 8986]|uniref:hypothetical protein n=1 Tax=Arcobacter sp. CECT 8986 TaxID=2044507 RepID=UPI001009A459|nr:hypothetical protein [Arcobacter sp. CECT 8986]RXJ98382.1 hypothetical protein CRU98_10105 [Arcobacter sp. CECT 8986]